MAHLTQRDPSESLVLHWPPTKPDKRVVQYSLKPHSSSLEHPFSLSESKVTHSIFT